MPELGRCQDASCPNEDDNLTVRVFPCLYHCKKMLCLQHLLEHDRNLEQQTELQYQLKQTWNVYTSMIDEIKIEEKIERLRKKLDDYRQLTQQIADLLTNDRSKPTIEQLRTGIEDLRRAIVRENRPMSMTTNVTVKDESLMDNTTKPDQQTMDNSSHSSSATAQNESQAAVESGRCTSNSIENSLNQSEEQQQLVSSKNCWSIVEESDGDDEPMDMNSDDNGDDSNSFRINNLDDDESNHKSNVRRSQSILLPGKRPCASHHRDYCPLTQDGVFGINSQVHGIRLCALKPPHEQHTLVLNLHFQNTHHMTPKASLTLARAIFLGQDPTTTRLFTDKDAILDVDKLRTVICPLQKPLFHYPSISITRTPCSTTKQVRHLQDHLKSAHKLTNTAAKLLVKAVKAHEPAHMIEFPTWIRIVDDHRYSF